MPLNDTVSSGSSSKNVKRRRSNVSLAVSATAPNALPPKTNVRPKTRKSCTVSDFDLSVGGLEECEDISKMDPQRVVAYGKFLRSMLRDCFMEKEIQRQETEMDIQISLLDNRFKETINQLEKTSQRMKEISFVVEQKRLLDLKKHHCNQLDDMLEKSNTKELLKNLNAAQASKLNRLETKNVDFGYDKETGHKQLLDAVNDALDGLDNIKKNSKLDHDKFKEFEKVQKELIDSEKNKFDLESLKSDFDEKYKDVYDRLLKEATEKIANIIECDDSDESED